MKKVLVGLLAGFIAGAGTFYTQKPRQQCMPDTVVQVQHEYSTITPHTKIDHYKSTKLETIKLKKESLEQYGKQLYDEMYNGECVELNKFLDAEEQIRSIYNEYGFEKAAVLYKSLENQLFNFRGETCKFQLDSSDLIAAATSSFSLEDFLKLKDYYVDEQFYYQSFSSRLAGYLSSQDKATREDYISELCEGQGSAFTEPLEADDAICPKIAYHFSEEVTNSVSSEVPEIALASEYLKSRSEINDASPLAEDNKKNLQKELISRVADIVCERYNRDSNSMATDRGFVTLKEFIELAERNLDLARAQHIGHYLNNSFGNDLEIAANEQCGDK